MISQKLIHFFSLIMYRGPRPKKTDPVHFPLCLKNEWSKKKFVIALRESVIISLQHMCLLLLILGRWWALFLVHY